MMLNKEKKNRIIIQILSYAKRKEEEGSQNGHSQKKEEIEKEQA